MKRDALLKQLMESADLTRLIPDLSGRPKKEWTEFGGCSAMNPEYSGPPENGVTEMNRIYITKRILSVPPVSDPTDSDDCSVVTPEVSNPPELSWTETRRVAALNPDVSFRPWRVSFDYGVPFPKYRHFYISVT